MKKLRKKSIFRFQVLLTVAVLISACRSLKPIVQNDSMQTLTENDLNKFNGDYEIISVDSSFRNLARSLAFSSDFNFQDLPKMQDRVNLFSIDRKHLKVTVYKNDKVIKTKVLKGNVSQNYFQFKLTHISFSLILNVFLNQRNRIGLLKNGNLTLDTDDGGYILLVFFPIGGDGAELYNLEFKRRPGSN